ncbi:MAG: T9SS type A sorting domain-containing protein [Saprospiraceae bacterium]|nr:T9SS type A sorting domain-containing protein [Saprospiraceae bacterium]
MKTINIFTFLFVLPLFLYSQQMVTVGSGYVWQAYYNFETGQAAIVENDAWDIGFSNFGQIDGGIFINESVSFMANPMVLYLAPTNDWNEDISDTSVYVDSIALFNPEQDWAEGAFNTPKDPDDFADYGWGTYDPSTHAIMGDRVFVIKKRNGQYIKFMMNSLAGGMYDFRYANLDGSDERNFTITRSDYADSPLIFFSLDTIDLLEDMPSNYDLIFQRYSAPLDAGDEIVQYTVTGVLLAPGSEGLEAKGVDPITVDHKEYLSDLTTIPSAIGHEWKYFDFASGWVVANDRVYFVKTRNDAYYKVFFTGFSGSSTGFFTFEVTELDLTSLEEALRNNIEIKVYPNPTTGYFSIEYPESISGLSARLYNMNGQMVKEWMVDTTIGYNLPIDIPGNSYVLQLYSGNDLLSVKKLIKQ